MAITPPAAQLLAAALRPTDVLTTGRAAAVAGRPGRVIRRLCKRGDIAAERTADKPRVWQIPATSLVAWLASQAADCGCQPPNHLPAATGGLNTEESTVSKTNAQQPSARAAAVPAEPTCPVCGCEFNTDQGMAQHVARSHKLNKTLAKHVEQLTGIDPLELQAAAAA